MVQYSFTSTETRRLVRTDSPGRPPRLSHSSWDMLLPQSSGSCVKVEVAVPTLQASLSGTFLQKDVVNQCSEFGPSLIVRTVSVDVKQH